MQNGLIIAETAHGFVCANAGVDASNASPDTVVLLPTIPMHRRRICVRNYDGDSHSTMATNAR